MDKLTELALHHIFHQMPATQLYRMRSVSRTLRHEVDEYLKTDPGVMKMLAYYLVNGTSTCQIVEQDMARFNANFFNTLRDCLNLIQGGRKSKLVDGFRIERCEPEYKEVTRYQVSGNCCIIFKEKILRMGKNLKRLGHIINIKTLDRIEISDKCCFVPFPYYPCETRLVDVAGHGVYKLTQDQYLSHDHLVFTDANEGITMIYVLNLLTMEGREISRCAVTKVFCPQTTAVQAIIDQTLQPFKKNAFIQKNCGYPMSICFIICVFDRNLQTMIKAFEFDGTSVKHMKICFDKRLVQASRNRHYDQFHNHHDPTNIREFKV
jgi:hypothetical protein